ncbi:MAG: DUF2227 family putative metal-binding protein [Microgenomates group bacterium]
MADGATHRIYINKGWIFIIPVGLLLPAIVAPYTSYWYLYTPFFYLNYFLCRYIDPDLDLYVVTTAEATAISDLKKINFILGFIGALFVSYSFIYAYIVGLFGGHRSWLSHGWGIGTIGRMMFFNIVPFSWMKNLYHYGIQNWQWTLTIGLYESMKMEIWLFPYISMQFLAWFIGDGIHLILDMKKKK